MTNTHFMGQRQDLQKILITKLQQELETLDAELQSVLVDDMITAFHNRLKVMKKFQDRQQKE